MSPLGCALLGEHARYLVLLEAAVLLLTQRGVGVAQYFTHARGGQKVVFACPGVVDALAEPHDLDLTHGACELVVHQLGDGVARLDGCAAEPLG